MIVKKTLIPFALVALTVAVLFLWASYGEPEAKPLAELQPLIMNNPGALVRSETVGGAVEKRTPIDVIEFRTEGVLDQSTKCKLEGYFEKTLEQDTQTLHNLNTAPTHDRYRTLEIAGTQRNIVIATAQWDMLLRNKYISVKGEKEALRLMLKYANHNPKWVVRLVSARHLLPADTYVIFAIDPSEYPHVGREDRAYMRLLSLEERKRRSHGEEK